MSGTAGEPAEKEHVYRIGPTEPASEAVVAAVSAATERGVESVPAGDAAVSSRLEPLYRTVDPDALDALFRPTAEGVRRDVRVAFRYAGCAVTVRADGVVRVRPNCEREVGDG